MTGVNQFKCSEIARQKCPEKAFCGDFTYVGTDCDCAKFNEKCLPTKQRDIISELRAENAALKSEREELRKALEMAHNEYCELCKNIATRCGVDTYCSHCERKAVKS